MRCIESAIAEVDAIQVRAQYAEAAALGRGPFDRSGQGAQFKAGCLVWLAAILERLFSDLAEEVREVVLQEGAADDVLHLNLSLALAQGPWQAAAVPNRDGALKRIDLVTRLALGAEDWPESFSFHDGRTVNDQSFRMVWLVLVLPGSAFPSSATPGVLRDLAGRRNRVAHGEETVLEAGRGLSFQDLFKILEHVLQTLERMLLAFEEWRLQQGWCL